MKNSQTYYRKNMWTKNPPYCRFQQVIYIYPEMEGFAVATQDWVIKTRN